ARVDHRARFFHLTAAGRSTLAEWVEQWTRTTATINELLTTAGALSASSTQSIQPTPEVHDRVDA
ncbi:MAG: hypothetical protein PGN11_13525, partial [Quadrisphaera sp.]